MRLERITSSLKVKSSNQLSYEIIMVGMSGFEPLPLDFQSSASTKLASSPLTYQMDILSLSARTVIKCITFIHRPSHGFTA
jgi:hypothetical protein